MTNEEKECYVQPECKVIQVEMQQIIAASGDAPDYRNGGRLDF